MKLTRLRTAVTAGVLALAGTTAAITLAVAPASAGPAVPPPVALVQCSGHASVRPATYDLGCMPSNVIMNKLRWVSWRSVAYGSGTLAVNNCTPSSSCGPSKYTKYPVLIVLWRAVGWSGHGRDYFSRMTLIFSGKRPHGAGVSQTSVLVAY